MVKLTAAAVRSINQPGKYHDQHGLILRVAPGGSKQWVWRGTVRGKRRDLGLGSAVYVTLAEARESAFQYRRLARAGGDPAALRSDQDVPTVAEAATAVIDLHRPTWRSPRSAAQWEASLRDYVLPVIGAKPVSEVTSADILRVLSPIWVDKAETARRVKQRLGAIFSWAIAEQHRPDDPVAAVAAALPKHDNRRQHFRALPHEEVAGALAKVRASEAWLATKACFEFIVATACRSGEARGARWDEIDGDVWEIPGSRTKTGRPHRVPLSSMALQALDETRGTSDDAGLIFASPTGRQLSDNTLGKLLRENDVDATVHGFRSSFRDWAAEEGVSREVAEHALGHIVTGVEGAYQRSDLLAARADVMEAWALYLRKL